MDTTKYFQTPYLKILHLLRFFSPKVDKTKQHKNQWKVMVACLAMAKIKA